MVELESFDVFCPKMLAGIGELPETISDRSITITMKRRTSDEMVARFRRREAEAASEPIRISLESWASHAIDVLSAADPVPPEGLSDRAEDGWEPLLAIADLAGGDWPVRARQAALALSEKKQTEESSRGVQLLGDIYEIFEETRPSMIGSRDLIHTLNARPEAPWGGYNNGAGISERNLARILKPFEITPKKLRVGSDTIRGYPRTAFEDAWKRYLPVQPPSPALERNKRNTGSTTPVSNPTPTGTGEPQFHVQAGDSRLNQADVPHVPLNSSESNGRLTDSEIERLGAASLDELRRLTTE